MPDDPARTPMARPEEEVSERIISVLGRMTGVLLETSTALAGFRDSDRPVGLLVPESLCAGKRDLRRCLDEAQTVMSSDNFLQALAAYTGPALPPQRPGGGVPARLAAHGEIKERIIGSLLAASDALLTSEGMLHDLWDLDRPVGLLVPEHLDEIKGLLRRVLAEADAVANAELLAKAFVIHRLLRPALHQSLTDRRPASHRKHRNGSRHLRLAAGIPAAAAVRQAAGQRVRHAVLTGAVLTGVSVPAAYRVAVYEQHARPQGPVTMLLPTMQAGTVPAAAYATPPAAPSPGQTPPVLPSASATATPSPVPTPSGPGCPAPAPSATPGASGTPPSGPTPAVQGSTQAARADADSQRHGRHRRRDRDERDRDEWRDRAAW